MNRSLIRVLCQANLDEAVSKYKQDQSGMNWEALFRAALVLQQTRNISDTAVNDLINERVVDLPAAVLREAGIKSFETLIHLD